MGPDGMSRYSHFDAECSRWFSGEQQKTQRSFQGDSSGYLRNFRDRNRSDAGPG